MPLSGSWLNSPSSSSSFSFSFSSQQNPNPTQQTLVAVYCPGALPEGLSEFSVGVYCGVVSFLFLLFLYLLIRERRITSGVRDAGSNGQNSASSAPAIWDSFLYGINLRSEAIRSFPRGNGSQSSIGSSGVPQSRRLKGWAKRIFRRREPVKAEETPEKNQVRDQRPSSIGLPVVLGSMALLFALFFGVVASKRRRI